MSAIRKPEPHDSASLHVAGKAHYVDDLPTVEGTLHLAFGLSSVARGRLVSVDLAPVMRSQGVRLAFTAGDIPGVNDVSPTPSREPLLAEDEVHYAGQPIFVVVADSHQEAMRAARSAAVVCDPLTPLISIDDALSAESFLDDSITYRIGNPDAAIAGAEVKITGRIEIGGQEHFYLEGQCALAQPLDNGDIHLIVSTQHPTETQHKVAELLGLPMSAVRVEVRRMGGGFGGKESQANPVAAACALAATLTGCPCKMRYDRDDDMIITGKRHDFRIDYRAGLGADAKIAGVAFDHFVRCGWSQDLSLPVADRAMLHADNAYYLPNARIRSVRLRTNTQSATAFRGFGGPQGMVGIEAVMDHAARELGLDPSKVRQRNFYTDYASGKKQKTPYHMVVEDCEINAMTAQLLRQSRYRRRRNDIDDWNRRNPVIRRGIALTPVKFGISFTLTHLNQAGALVHVYHDGSIILNHGGTEMGQGLFVKVAQIAAEAFGQPLEAVKITATDTDKVPNTSATAASSGSDLNGMATRIACDKIVDRISGFLARQHQASIDDMRFSDGKFEIGGETYEFTEAVKLAYANRVSLSATGYYATPKISWDRILGRGRPFYYFAYGAAVSEVAVDTLTGENRILRTDILHEAGKSLNPAIDIGQIEGGFVQGAGWLTTEELVWDERGSLKTHAPSTYKIPTSSDLPPVFNVELWSPGRNREKVIHRSKAVGEPPLMLGLSVLMAINDAVASCGDSDARPVLVDAPATPERVLAAISRIQRG